MALKELATSLDLSKNPQVELPNTRAVLEEWEAIEDVDDTAAYQTENDQLNTPEGDIVRYYFNDISPLSSLLEPDEVVVLAKRIEAGKKAHKELNPERKIAPEKRVKLEAICDDGIQAATELTHHNTRLVISIAKNYTTRHMSFLDRIQEGNIGLIRAVGKFDYRRKTLFSTYATWWIRQAITRAMGNQERTIRIPINQKSTVGRIMGTYEALLQEFGREPTADEIAERTQLPEEKVAWLMEVAKDPYSFERPVGDNDNATFGDFVEDKKNRPELHAVSSNLSADIETACAQLTPTQRYVIYCRFGFTTGKKMTFQAIADELGRSKEGVRQLAVNALKILRKPEIKNQLAPYLLPENGEE